VSHAREAYDATAPLADVGVVNIPPAAKGAVGYVFLAQKTSTMRTFTNRHNNATLREEGGETN